MIASEGTIWNFLQSPHGAANCLQHTRSSGSSGFILLAEPLTDEGSRNSLMWTKDNEEKKYSLTHLETHFYIIIFHQNQIVICFSLWQ